MKKNKIIISILTIGILIVGFGIFNKAEAADPSLYVFPSSLNKKVGDTFNISIVVNPNDEKVCVVEGKLNLDKLSCQKVTMGSSISAQTSPSCDDIGFLLGIPGCTTSTKTLFTVEVKAKNTGTGTANFTGVDIIGEGVSLSPTTGDGSYTITSVPSCDCGTWGSWQNGACGDGNCSSNQRLQTHTRTCVPSGCDVGVESRCIEDSSCGVQEAQEGEAQMPPSGHKPLVINPEETMPQKGLLATAMTGISESAFATIFIILCLGGLVVIGAREWSLVRQKKNK